MTGGFGEVDQRFALPPKYLTLAADYGRPSLRDLDGDQFDLPYLPVNLVAEVIGWNQDYQPIISGSDRAARRTGIACLDAVGLGLASRIAEATGSKVSYFSEGLLRPVHSDEPSVVRADRLEVLEDNAIVGVTADLRSGTQPLNGLRHPPGNNTTGWYLWAGETFPVADDAFQPLHLSHLRARSSEVLPYLAMAPGSRFLIAPGYEDVWFDEGLL